ncbi:MULTISPECIES: hypothetical protein [unclassified Pseudomonas]|uniref:hypothetical protein n=1 Tax=unclassified Pseudomonas TaxID=196821 RepID=UPI0019149654|nr:MULTISPECIES: hypothetical protein [unclassified Pseudomonas]MBK4987839.1 hypothetical protein [Pseudomonas sp. S36]MBK5005633.1 hypothetical protein [Pseudomonas sp. S32]
MTGDIWELLNSLDLQSTVAKVEQGVALDFAQHSLLREVADARFYQLMRKVSAASLEPATRELIEADLRALQEACLHVAHLLQISCLALRRLGLDAAEQRLAREALESQQACIQACLRRSLASFDRSA